MLITRHSFDASFIMYTNNRLQSIYSEQARTLKKTRNAWTIFACGSQSHLGYTDIDVLQKNRFKNWKYYAEVKVIIDMLAPIVCSINQPVCMSIFQAFPRRIQTVSNDLNITHC